MGLIIGGLAVLFKFVITAVFGAVVKVGYDKMMNIAEVKGAVLNGFLNVKRAFRKNFMVPIYFRGVNEIGKLSVCESPENGPCFPVEEFISKENIEGGDIVCDSEGSCIKFKEHI